MQFPLPQNPLFIPGPSGQLEAVVAPPATELMPIMGIICHPHPLHGGTMQNKVVSTLARAFYDLGVWSIRFNFRGVGASAGTYDYGKGEVDDLFAIVAWAQEHFPNYHLWLAGFSFGAYIAMQGVLTQNTPQEPIQQLITIAPPVNYFEFTQNISIDIPWLLIMGEEDEIVPVQAVKEWAVAHPSPRLQAIYLPGVGHFFHGLSYCSISMS